MQDSEPIMVYTTFPDFTSAKRIGGELVENRKAACVNILNGMTSVYSWEGKLETSEEVVMIVKTTSARADEVVAMVEELHPYDTPAILSWPVNGGSKGFIDWIAEMTAKGES